MSAAVVAGVPCLCADGSVVQWLVVGLLGGAVPAVLLVGGALLTRCGERWRRRAPAGERPASPDEA